MPDFFAGKVVIVTGSSTGIGSVTARQFAARGAKVTITGRNAEALAQTKQSCIEAGAKEDDILEVIGEITNEEVVDRIVNGTVEKFGQLDVLVNNAGAAFNDHGLHRGIDQHIEIYDKTLALNTRSVIVISKAAVPHLEKTKGAIVNVSSIAGLNFVSPFSSYYAMSKACLDQLTVQMAGTLIRKGIRVNSVNPGIIKTDFMSKIGIPKEVSERLYEGWGADSNAIPVGRHGVPEDIGNVILFLADRSLSEFIVGQRIVSDGGSTIKNTLISKEPDL